jgi:hypothetical protein
VGRSATYALWYYYHSGKHPLALNFLNSSTIYPACKKVKVYTEGTPAFLPSSLTNIDPDALGFSPHPPVSVYGTDTLPHDYDAFLGTLIHTNPPCGVSLYIRAYSIPPTLADRS